MAISHCSLPKNTLMWLKRVKSWGIQNKHGIEHLFLVIEKDNVWLFFSWYIRVFLACPTERRSLVRTQEPAEELRMACLRSTSRFHKRLNLVQSYPSRRPLESTGSCWRDDWRGLYLPKSLGGTYTGLVCPVSLQERVCLINKLQHHFQVRNISHVADESNKTLNIPFDYNPRCFRAQWFCYLV